jgi:hypothetical protein
VRLLTLLIYIEIATLVPLVFAPRGRSGAALEAEGGITDGHRYFLGASWSPDGSVLALSTGDDRIRIRSRPSRP